MRRAEIASSIRGAALLRHGAQLLGEQRVAQLAVRLAAHKGLGQRVVQAAVDPGCSALVVGCSFTSAT